MKREYSKNTTLSYLHTVQLLRILRNLKVTFTANKEVTRNHCSREYFVQQVATTFIPRAFVSGLAQLFPCCGVSWDICCPNLHPRMRSGPPERCIAAGAESGGSGQGEIWTLL